jgi:hypothetical protein
VDRTVPRRPEPNASPWTRSAFRADALQIYNENGKSEPELTANYDAEGGGQNRKRHVKILVAALRKDLGIKDPVQADRRTERSGQGLHPNRAGSRLRLRGWRAGRHQRRQPSRTFIPGS